MSALLAVLLGLAAPSWAKDPVRVPEIPGLFEFRAPQDSTAPLSVSTAAGVAELKSLILSEGPLPARLDALRLWDSHLAQAFVHGKSSATRGDFWSGEEASLDLMSKVLDGEKDPAFRRWAFFQLFVNSFPTARDRILLDPEDPAWVGVWPRFDKLRVRAAKDDDPQLREFMRRYDPVPAPAWAEQKSDDRVYLDEVEKLRPESKKDYEALWNLFQSVEDNNRAFTEASIKQAGVKALAPIERSLFDHRMAVTWGTMFPTALSEMLGPADKAAAALIRPVANGWPDFSGLQAEKKP